MKHALADNLMELRMEGWVWNLSRDNSINLPHSLDLVLVLKEDEEMHVREAMLLILNCVHKACNSTKVAITNLFQQGLLLGMENPCHQVRMINSFLP